MDKCAACHGEFGESAGRWPQLAQGRGTLASHDPVKTVGSYLPYLSSVFDYIRRSMPFGDAQSLGNDELYAVTAYVLYLNDVVDDKFVLSKETWGKVKMPNAAGFFDDDRETAEKAFWNSKSLHEGLPRAGTGLPAARERSTSPPMKRRRSAAWSRDLAARQPVAGATSNKEGIGRCRLCSNEERSVMPGATAGRGSVRFEIGAGERCAVAGYVLTLVGGMGLGFGADVELGRYLSSECMTCHGTAKADSTIPNIFGLGRIHLTEVLRAYRAKALPNPVMQTIAGRLNDEDIAALALYFATAKKPN